MISRRIDQIVNLLKWPAALLAVLALPGAAITFAGMVRATAAQPSAGWPIILGAGVFTALYLLLFRRPTWGRFFSTFEHELTHALFAWATFHRVTGFKATFKSGGHIQFAGKGNWLITASPYFFPTWCVLLAPLLLLPHQFTPWVLALIGAALAYHVCSTVQETHRHQTDLKELGMLFVMLFMPAANLLAFGLVLAVSLGGLRGGAILIDRVVDHTLTLIRAVTG